MNTSPRPVGSSGCMVGPLGLGCWPLAGMTRSGITPAAAVATVQAALDAGIVHLDTAYCYGETGESERAIAVAMKGRHRDALVLASKCGIHWEPGRRQCVDGRPERLHTEVNETLARLDTDHVDILYLHAPDPMTPIEESAGAWQPFSPPERLAPSGCRTRHSNSCGDSRPPARFPPARCTSTCCSGRSRLKSFLGAAIMEWRCSSTGR